MQLFSKFQKFAVCHPYKGTTVLFWSDDCATLKDLYPQLFSFTRKQKCSVRFFLDQSIHRIFSLPLTTLAAQQLEEIDNLLQHRLLDEDTNDVWSYSWGTANYRSKKAYKVLIGHTPCSPLFNWLWKSSNLGKHKFFFWLLLRDRLSTRNMLSRKNMALEDYNCVLCNAGCEETSFHLFFGCSFSLDSWSFIPIKWGTDLP